MKWEGRRQSTNVEFDCLGMTIKDFDEGVACHAMLNDIRNSYLATPGSSEMQFDAIQRAFMSENPAKSGEQGSAINQMLSNFSIIGDETPTQRIEKFRETVKQKIEDNKHPKLPNFFPEK